MKKLVTLLSLSAIFLSSFASASAAGETYHNPDFDYTVDTQGLYVEVTNPGANTTEVPANVVTFKGSKDDHWVYVIETFNDSKTTMRSIIDDFAVTHYKYAMEEYNDKPTNVRIQIRPFPISSSLKGMYIRVLPAHDYGDVAVAFEKDGKTYLISGDSSAKFKQFVKSFRFDQE